MKREIICIVCKDSKIRRMGFQYSEEFQSIVDPYPEEHVKIVRGQANKDFICDSCNKLIKARTNCFAVSMWADYSEVPYYEWEKEFVT